MHNSPWFTLSRHDEDEPKTDPTPAEGGDKAPKTFTQAELDAIVGDRLKRQKGQFADYDDLKSKATRLAEIEAGQQTELEKAQARADAAEKTAADTARKTAERIAAAELKAALTGLVDSPADVIDDLNLAKFIGDDGEVDAEAVSKLQAKYAAIAAKKPTGDLDPGPRGDGKSLDYRSASPAQVKAELARNGVTVW